ncbi:MAG: aminotransferase class V-fold PLP-dependent enzyme [Cytophagales bacterium]|nr:aminotransferase class V-fold PLP-dependent enzyme [Cytophagales bacterium]MCA6366776.1 aminotransferase class V-fold PLP-dependent enzyme [Cytophagales bacterium]MCA6370834.1 aminotransferase class V-fold PLP-dependent enzyme [Cytophagales bacterium]MCA6375744.1 aminotransferase class V-fold PLP-dependent enzyme [Cytophagales bacterium]MCA6384694.1 aminotransferase class V-fold PLP-dependent enzyme [Cytophagales bacterium]
MTKTYRKSNIEELVELSLVQRGRLFQYLKDADEASCNAQIVLAIDGPLDIKLVGLSLSHVQQSNPALRSAFIWNAPANPLQVVFKDVAHEFVVKDFSLKRDKHTLCANYFEQNRDRHFDLTNVPIRYGVVRLSDNSHLFHITHHRILLDSVSVATLLKDVLFTYDSLLQNITPACRSKVNLSEIYQSLSGNINQQVANQYWAEYLKDYNIVNVSSRNTSIEKEKIKTIYVAAGDLYLDLFASTNDLSRESIVCAAYGLLLQKYLCTDDVVFGIQTSYRENAHNIEDVLGNFDNILPVRIKDEKNVSFLKTVKAVNNQSINRRPHQNISYFDLKRAAGIRAIQELFDSVLTFEDALLYNTISNDAATCRVRLHSTNENVHVPLHIQVSFEAGLHIAFRYHTGYVDGEMVKALSTHLPVVIRAILDDPSKSLNAIQILTDEERQTLLYKFNSTRTEMPEDRAIIGLFEKQVRETPRRLAVYDAAGSLTFEELHKKINQLTSFLQTQGVDKGDVIGLLMDRSIDFVVSSFAILKAGALYLPIDAGNPGERIGYILRDSNVNILLTKEKIINTKDIRLSCRVFCYEKLLPELEHFSNAASESREGENVYVVYTSGSTGTPKGVIGSRSGLLNRLHWGWRTYPTQEGEVFCLKTNIGFVDHVVEMFSPLLSGVPLRIFSDDEVLDVPKMYAHLVDEKITRILVVPTYLKALISLKRKEKPTAHSLKYVFCSGEQLPAALARKFYAEFSEVLLVNIYGSTEVSADVTYHNVERYDVEDVLKYFKRYTLASNNLFTTHKCLAVDDESITFPNVDIGELAENFQNASVSEYPISMEKYFSDFQRDVLPYCVDTASPRFIGHMTSVLPDYVHDVSKLISQLNQNLVKIETSKSLTFIEREAIAMLHSVFYSFSDTFYNEHIQKLNSNLGIITSGGSTANMSALLSARNKLLFSTAGQKLSGKSIYQQLQASGYKDFVLIGSRLMHYSFHKAVSMLGLGTDNILYVKNDAEGKIDIMDLQEKIDYCSEQKLLIIAIIGIAGATETGCIDPLNKMGEIARENNIHFHVDAAWGGLIKFSDKYAKLLGGIELADSITFCGHKQLFLPQGISVCLFKDPHQLNYNSTVARYQATADSFDFGRITLEGSKPGLSLCLHASLRILGKKGYALLLDRGIKLANVFARIIHGTTSLELVSHHINILNYRYIPAAFRERDLSKLSAEETSIINQINSKIQATQFLKGRTFVSKTKIRAIDGHEIVVFRAVLSNPLTTHQDLESVINDQFSIIDELYGEKNTIDFIGDLYLDDHDDSREEGIRGVPIGKPISNTKIFILDKNNGLQPVGVVGELCIAGAGVADGYLNNDALSSEKFIANPFQKGALYKTGDLARWLVDGSVEFLGRLDDQIKIHGYRVALGEIENKLIAYPEITDAVVVAKDRRGEICLIAYYSAELEIPHRVLRNYLSSYLPEYMTPTHYIHLDKILVTSTGKADRKALAEPAFKAEENYVPPTTERERLLVDIWSDQLGISKEKISVNRCFFELGGNSLNLLVLRKNIEEKLKVRISVADLFKYSNIQAIVAHMDHASFREDHNDIELNVLEINSYYRDVR